ncbi:DUF202 domain-containing protein [Maribius pontilimi]|uniref:DUF202 domain-containing protein n=1 Tax=Palleronia pontilimi TaxID=1964209 RepID=A0A934IGZ2_9RHOB|nr:DUF202 domain-containing protein [Palleronia pontilimi]MBJ3762656.1 DUF202 domain-containing protein [Palleronia pontilimi]
MSDKNKLAQDRTQWAEDRTDWAEDRTILAAERTYAGWVRTGLTTMVVAIALQGVFGPAEPDWLPKAVATIFIFAALCIFVAGWAEAIINRRNFSTWDARCQPLWRLHLLTVVLCCGTVFTGVVLWLL